MPHVLLLLTFLVAALWPASAVAERKVALVVGNGTYTHVPKLANPINDAAAIADLFRRAGFEVVEAKNDLGSVDLKRVVRDFSTHVRNADIAVMYFAGHGIEIGGINYLIPTDARLANDLDAEDEALPLDRVVRILEPAKRLRLVILDACRDNPFVKGMRRSVATRAVSRGLAQVEPATSDTLIAFAAKAGSTADDGVDRHSPFTAALLKHITVPGLDVRIALGRVRDEVKLVTNQRQDPFVYGSLGGATVALIPEPQAAIPAAIPGPAPAVNPVADTRRDYELAERVGTREAWDSFLVVHKSGFYAELARSARGKLGAVPTQPPRQSPPAIVFPSAETVPPGQTEPRIAARPPADLAPPREPDKVSVIRQLQRELKRVGCHLGSVDDDWGGKSRQALALFNRHADTRFDVKTASLEAIEGVRGKEGRVCPLDCGRGSRAEGDTCVAIHEPAAEPRPRERNVHEPVTRREPPRREERRAAPERDNARQSRGGGSISPLCQRYFSQGGRRCCSYEQSLNIGVPETRTVCQ
jgi:hypothetical protein